MSANPFSIAVSGRPPYSRIERALTATGVFAPGPVGGLTHIRHPRVWLESEDDAEAPGLHSGGWTIDVHPDREQELTRRVAHEAVDLLAAAGIEAYVFHDDPDARDPRPGSPA